jgi:C1A family cysteine protease
MIDWRYKCTPIRDQGSCGSCTAFGAIGAIEALLRIKYATEKDLSERDLFACSGGKCSEGNTVEATLDRAMSGIATEDKCPYVPKDSTCMNYDRSAGAKITGYGCVIGTKDIKQALGSGPVVGTMAVHESFLHYRLGVYHSLGQQDPIIGYHCITIVGYDDALGAWLIRNSWGAGWGLRGYAMIKYGDSKIDTTAYTIYINTPSPTPIPKSKCCGIGLLRKVFRRFL